ncbi:MAG: NAD(P)-dependent oxidoreductase [Candidatus Rokuibacteriota bacterium]
MKIALIGATGHAGSRILAELVDRGHHVTGIARDTTKVKAHPRVTPTAADASDPDRLSSVVAGHDAVISAIRFVDSDPRKLIAAVKAAGVKRYLVVGGAGSLEVAPGRRLVDAPSFPAAARAEALRGAAFLGALRDERSLEWTFLSPSASFTPGRRTGTFRLGGDQLLTDDTGQSGISFEDFAVALTDELETPRHVRQRFTVGY